MKKIIRKSPSGSVKQSRFVYCPERSKSRSQINITCCYSKCKSSDWCSALDKFDRKTKEEIMAELSRKQMEKAALEVNKLFGLDPAIDAKASDEELKASLSEAGSKSEERDVADLSEETWSVFKDLNCIPKDIQELVNQKLEEKTEKPKGGPAVSKKVMAKKKTAAKKTTVKKTTVKKTAVKKTAVKPKEEDQAETKKTTADKVEKGLEFREGTSAAEVVKAMQSVEKGATAEQIAKRIEKKINSSNVLGRVNRVGPLAVKRGLVRFEDGKYFPAK